MVKKGGDPRGLHVSGGGTCSRGGGRGECKSWGDRRGARGLGTRGHT